MKAIYHIKYEYKTTIGNSRTAVIEDIDEADVAASTHDEAIRKLGDYVKKQHSFDDTDNNNQKTGKKWVLRSFEILSLTKGTSEVV